MVRNILAIILVCVMIFAFGACGLNNNGYEITTEITTTIFTTVEETTLEIEKTVYILNTRRKTIHKQGCYSADMIKEENKKEHKGEYAELLRNGYSKCGHCF